MAVTSQRGLYSTLGLKTPVKLLPWDSYSHPITDTTCAPKEGHPTSHPPSCFSTPAQTGTSQEEAPAPRQSGCFMITCDSRHPGNILSLGGAVSTLLPASACCWPSGPDVDFTHFEEGHHERLLVIRAISPYKACFSRIYTETFKSNGKLIVGGTTQLDCSFQRCSIPINRISSLLDHAVSLLALNPPLLPPWPVDIFTTAPHPPWTRSSTMASGSLVPPMKSLLHFRHETGIEIDI